MRGKILFTGSFGVYFWSTVGLGILSILTLGLLLPYLMYWQTRYFFTHMELVVGEQWDGHHWVPMMAPPTLAPPVLQPAIPATSEAAVMETS